jgi:hypothetical protein
MLSDPVGRIKARERRIRRRFAATTTAPALPD